MAEQETEFIKFTKKKQRIKHWKKMQEEHILDPNFGWFLKNKMGIAHPSVEHKNNFMPPCFWKHNVHFCLLWKNPQYPDYQTYGYYTKQYCHVYNRNGRDGFYPTNYTMQEKADEAGENMKEVAVNDLEQLATLPTKNKGSKFYFAGVKYTITVKMIKNDEKDYDNYSILAENKPLQELIIVRHTQDSYAIFNIGKEGNTKRQNYGANSLVHDMVNAYCKNIFHNPLEVDDTLNDGGFITVKDEYLDNGW